MSVTSFKHVTAFNPMDLQTAVRDAIGAGYEVYSPPFSTPSGVLSQPMVTTDDPPPFIPIINRYYVYASTVFSELDGLIQNALLTIPNSYLIGNIVIMPNGVMFQAVRAQELLNEGGGGESS